MYPPSSWQYVLYGMEFKTDINARRAAYPRTVDASEEFRMIRQMSQHALADLPPHRALVEHYCARAVANGAQAAQKKAASAYA